MGAIKDARLCDRRTCFAYRAATGQCDALRSVIEPDCPFYKTVEQNLASRRKAAERLPHVDWDDAVHKRIRRISEILRAQEEMDG